MEIMWYSKKSKKSLVVALYGMLVLAVLFHKELQKDLEEIGLKVKCRK